LPHGGGLARAIQICAFGEQPGNGSVMATGSAELELTCAGGAPFGRMQAVRGNNKGKFHILDAAGRPVMCLAAESASFQGPRLRMTLLPGGRQMAVATTSGDVMEVQISFGADTSLILACLLSVTMFTSVGEALRKASSSPVTRKAAGSRSSMFSAAPSDQTTISEDIEPSSARLEAEAEDSARVEAEAMNSAHLAQQEQDEVAAMLEESYNGEDSGAAVAEATSATAQVEKESYNGEDSGAAVAEATSATAQVEKDLAGSRVGKLAAQFNWKPAEVPLPSVPGQHLGSVASFRAAP